MKNSVLAACLLFQWLFAPLLQATQVPDEPSLATEAKGGRFSLLSIDVAEQGLGQQEQERLASIGLLLQSFDIVLLQENYKHRALLKQGFSGQYTQANLPLPPSRESAAVSDEPSSMGLNTLTRFETGRFAFFRWFRQQSVSSDNKQQAKDGVTVTTTVLKKDQKLSAELDAYNINLTVESGDNALTEVNDRITTLIEFISGRDKQGLRPLVISGRFDFRRLTNESEALAENIASNIVQRLQSELNAAQVFSELHGFVGDHKGRWIFYRSGDNVRLKPLEALLPGKQFRGEGGRMLTLEVPAAVSFNWFVQAEPETKPEPSEPPSDSGQGEPSSGGSIVPDKPETPDESDVVVETVDDDGNLIREEPSQP